MGRWATDSLVNFVWNIYYLRIAVRYLRPGVFSSNVRCLVGWDTRVPLENEDGTRLVHLALKIFILLSFSSSTPSPWNKSHPPFF
jgi:hypothetical protein